MTIARRKSAPHRGPEVVAAVAVVLVVAVALVYVAFGLLTASTTLGCDYDTYADAAARHLAGQPIYPLGAARTGDCGLYQYPPPFLLVILPFSALGSAGVWAWIAASAGAFAAGTALLPVQRWVRLAVFFLGAIGWPFIFGLRIGQVGPLLFLLFAVGWRFLERPGVLGAVVGLGTLIKAQPAVVGLWLLARLDIRALLVAAATVASVVIVGAVVGLADWAAFVRIIRDISQAIDVPTNLSIGATLYQLGVARDLATAIQTVNTVGLIVLVLWAGRALPAVPGYLLAVTVSQIVSPIVWSHYALILLLPVAWLLDRRQWWAVAIPLVHLWVLLPFVPNWTYPLVFYATLAGLVIAGWRMRRTETAQVVGIGATA